MKNIDNYDFNAKKAIIRVDFNVPLNDEFIITDDTRIKRAIPTIKKVLEKGGAAILMSHLGRPKGEINQKYSLKHIVEHVSKLLGQKILFADDCIGESTKKLAENLKNGEVLLLENLRFNAGEKKGDEDFAKKLAQLADVYINDAFGTAHRAHASTTVIAKFFPEEKMFGYIMEAEVKSLNKVVENQQRPFTAILGGAKVSSKITIIENMLNKVDNLIIGGAMAFTFVKAQGGKIGASMVEDDHLQTAKDIINKAEQKGVKLFFAVDSVNANKFDENAEVSYSPINNIPEGLMSLDIGEKSLETFSQVILQSKTILWNGPVGVFEMEKFANGTIGVAKAIVKATKNGSFSLVGGGDSVAAINKFNMADKVSYVSTGGGALLEYIEGKTLPGIAAIIG